MQQELKEKWLKALRSGEYSQGTAALRTNIGYCCLGVLADVMGAKWVKPSCDEPETEWSIERSPAIAYLPTSYAKRAGLDSEIQDQLATMNDGGSGGFNTPLKFPEIADWIEKEL
jgi:hypothetical protein